MFVSVMAGKENIFNLNSNNSWYMLAGEESFTEDNEKSTEGDVSYLSREGHEKRGKDKRRNREAE